MSDVPIRVAAVQAAPRYMDLEGSTARAVELIDAAAAGGARLVAFPETWIPGYPFWVWLDGVFANMPRFLAYRANAMRADGPHMRRIREAAAAARIHVVLGFCERRGDSLFLSQAIIDDGGALLAVRRKLRPTMAERMVFGEGDGSDLCVVDSALGRIGALCCWEHLQPLVRYAMYAQHEHIHVAAWPSFGLEAEAAHALGAEVNLAVSRVYAVEGQCFVLAPTSVIDRATLAAIADGGADTAPFRAGGGFTAIFAPDGRRIDEPLAEDAEGLVFADLDPTVAEAAKVAADPVGHYARPDVLRLWWNRAPAPCVEHGAIPAAEPIPALAPNAASGEQ